jgi:hypothetical protein
VEQQQQQPRLTILLSISAPTTASLPLGYQPPSCTVDHALAHDVSAAAAAARQALCGGGDDARASSSRIGRRLRPGRQVLLGLIARDPIAAFVCNRSAGAAAAAQGEK